MGVPWVYQACMGECVCVGGGPPGRGWGAAGGEGETEANASSSASDGLSGKAGPTLASGSMVHVRAYCETAGSEVPVGGGVPSMHGEVGAARLSTPGGVWSRPCRQRG